MDPDLRLWKSRSVKNEVHFQGGCPKTCIGSCRENRSTSLLTVMDTPGSSDCDGYPSFLTVMDTPGFSPVSSRVLSGEGRAGETNSREAQERWG